MLNNAESLSIAGKYSLQVMGSAGPDSLQESYDPDAVIDLTDAQLEELHRICMDRIEAGQVILGYEDGCMPLLYRLIDWTLNEKGGLVLSLGRTDYAQYLLTNAEHPEWLKQYGPEKMSNALGVTAVTLTTDGKMLFGRRATNLGEDRGMCHVIPSGHPEPSGSILSGVYAEMKEELGLEPDCITDTVVTGLVTEAASHKPDVTFMFKTKLAYDEILNRIPPQAWEFDAYFTQDWSPQAVTQFLTENLTIFTAPGHAAVLLAGQADFGQDWFQETLTRLNVSTTDVE